jgi:hypothetical protein
MPTAASRLVDPPSLADPATRARLSGPALRGFRALAERWGLPLDQQLALLGSPARSTYFAWKRASPTRAPVLSADTLTRVSLLLGIFAALERWLGNAPHEADAWIGRANDDHPFYGRSPLALMLDGGIPAMTQVRGYLDTLAGGPPSALSGRGRARR